MKSLSPLLEDLVDQKFGELTVISFAYIKNKKTYWNCKCSCSGDKIGRSDMLKNGTTNSCGCKTSAKLSEVSFVHGFSRGENKHPLYATWNCMRQRCTNPNYTDYHNYGGRGIKVCERWDDFLNFQEDMGVRPKGYTLDRKNNNKDYCPENCIWSDKKSQNRNKRTNHFLELNGEKKTMVEWSEILNLPFYVLAGRSKRGWSDEKTLTHPYTPRK